MTTVAPVARQPARASLTFWVLLATILASGMVFIDGTALSVALPAMQAGLGATGADLLWVTNGFSLPLAALLLLGGALGDRFGRKRVFTLGILIFSVSSLACGLAPSVSALITARIVQGVGGALMIPGSLALISTFYAPADRGRAIGTWSAFSVVATSIGPVLGGLLARMGLWRWVFFINLPLALTVLGVLFQKLPSDADSNSSPPVDWRGALTISLGLGAINFALLQSHRSGLGDAQNMVIFTVGLGALAFFIVAERGASAPLLPLSVFRSRTLTLASLLSLLFFMAFHGMLFFLPLNLIQVQQYDPALAGLTQLPLMALLVLLSRFAGGLVDRYGPRLPLTLGPLVAGVGLWWFSLPGLTAGPRAFSQSYLPGLLVIGAGLGLSAAPLSTAIMDSLDAQHLGLASGINSTLSRLAGVMAIAILGPIAMIHFSHTLESRTAHLHLSPSSRAHLRQDSIKLAETRPPPNESVETAAALHQQIKLAFVDTFRLIAKLTATLSCLAGFLGWLLPREKAFV